MVYTRFTHVDQKPGSRRCSTLGWFAILILRFRGQAVTGTAIAGGYFGHDDANATSRWLTIAVPSGAALIRLECESGRRSPWNG